MKFAYISVTGNTRLLVNKFTYDTYEINDGNADNIVDFNFILFAPTYEKEVTYILDDFLEVNHGRCLGLVGCGNLNFDNLYCFTAKDLSKKFNIPIIRLLEYSGSHVDVEYIEGVVEGFGKA